MKTSPAATDSAGNAVTSDRLQDLLRQLAMDFWCGIGDRAMLAAWIRAAWDAGLDPGVPPAPTRATASGDADAATTRWLVLQARDIAGFELRDWEAEPFAMTALHRALDLFIAGPLSAPALCALVGRLDAVFNGDLAGIPHHAGEDPAPAWWLGELWNACDWCDEHWTRESSPNLLAEAQRLRALLSA